MFNNKPKDTDYIERPLGDHARAGAWHMCRPPWSNDNTPHPRIILAVEGPWAIYAIGTTKRGCAMHGPGSMPVFLRRKTFVNTSSIDVIVKGILRHPGIYAGKIDEMTRLSVRRTPLFDESWGGWLPHSELRRLRKAMGYQDLRRRVLGKPLNEVPQRYSTIYLRDEVGMLHGAVVLACSQDNLFDVALAKRGGELLHDLSYAKAGLDTARSFDPVQHRRIVSIDDVVSVMGELCAKDCLAMEQLSETNRRW